MTDKPAPPEHSSAPRVTTPLEAASLLVEAKRQLRRCDPRAAEALYRRVLDSDDENPEALHFLGLALQQLGRHDLAIGYISRSVLLSPENADFHNNFAVALGRIGRAAESLEEGGRALRIRPDFAEAHSNRGVALERMGRPDEAIGAFKRAIELRSDYVEAIANLGNCLSRLGRLEEAIEKLRQAIAIQPRHAGAHRALGGALRRQGLEEEAIAAFRRAIEVNPRDADSLNNLGAALQECGQMREAIETLNIALSINPNHRDAHWNLGLALLASGEWQRGWIEYEWRRHLREDVGQRRDFPQPPWNGSPINGRTILLLSEQGLGDTIQFARYASLLADRGARVVLECQPRLRPLLRTLRGVERVVARGEPLPAFDVYARLISLPGMFGATPDTVPADVPYVQADPQRVAEWRARMEPAPGFEVGLAWQGSTRHPGDKLRSIPLAEFALLAKVDGTVFFSLQQGFGVEQIAPLRSELAVIQFDAPVDEACGAFVDTAAIMKSLDLVVTSDTSIAHLAGALGVRTWLALPYAADWRWLLDREDSPWYPTMRLFRQPQPRDWAGVFARMADQLPLIMVDCPNPPRLAPIMARMRAGELIDKITILQIKSKRLADSRKQAAAKSELDSLLGRRDEALQPSHRLDELTTELHDVNDALWQIEDDIRVCENAGDFGPRFVELARGVYHHNDRRWRIKCEIDVLLGSEGFEEKQYAAYSSATLIT
ncbi:MAG TPA: tetratricopeptide repeat protein [Tepidisphaeraceae bacterium]|nr:tetratricopeptide repeat protein [Tepidisphaeraceae bacterium]